jgi:anti-sigma factor RsiW
MTGSAHEGEDVMVGLELDLMAYLDGELPDDKREELAARLEKEPELSARLRALEAVTGFVRADADRIYDTLGIDDGLTAAIMAKVAAEEHEATNVVPIGAAHDLAPPTSRSARYRKNTVIWLAVGTVAAAAAGLFLYVRSHETPSKTAQLPQTTSATETVVAVQTVTTSTAQMDPTPQPIETSGVEVEDLEVGEGATVIYTRGAAVVWINEKN